MSKNYCQCLLFKQFTTIPTIKRLKKRCQRTIVNVYFSSNSQLVDPNDLPKWDVKELLSMFTFQAIHNWIFLLLVVCFRCQRTIVNVYFSSNSQPAVTVMFVVSGCQRTIVNVYFSSNSQPTSQSDNLRLRCQRTIVNVYFSSNSQQILSSPKITRDVKELLSMFTFQAIHNNFHNLSRTSLMSKNYCQCLLFKQFTTSKSFVFI